MIRTFCQDWYQHTKRSNFITHKGVDKLFGARAMADVLQCNLQDSLGAGDTGSELEEMAPLVKAFNILNYSQAVELAIEKNDQSALGAIRLRLNGCFDLYSLS